MSRTGGGVAIVARVGRMHPSHEAEGEDGRVPLDGLVGGGDFDADLDGDFEDFDLEAYPHSGEFLPRPASDDMVLVNATTGRTATTAEGGVAREARTPFSRLLVSTLHRDPAVRDALFRLVHFGASVERRPRRWGGSGATFSDANR